MDPQRQPAAAKDQRPLQPQAREDPQSPKNVSIQGDEHRPKVETSAPGVSAPTSWLKSIMDRLTGRQTMRFETCKDEILELAFTEVGDGKRAPNAYQEAPMKMFA